MIELTLFIIAMVVLWKSGQIIQEFFENQTEKVKIISKEQKVEMQEELAELEESIDKSIEKHGKWIKMKDIEDKMK